MKKLLSFWVAVIMLTASFSAVFGADDITVMLDGTKLEFDVQPQIINDRTMVPMRAIFEALGADVNWDGTTRTVTADKDDTEIIMTIGYELMFVNYDTITLDAPPVIIDDRTLVPLRAIAESLECQVDWEEDTRTVTIATSDDTVATSAKASSGSGSASSSKESVSPEASATPAASPATGSKSDTSDDTTFSPAPTAQATAGDDDAEATAAPEADSTDLSATAAPASAKSTPAPAETVSSESNTDENTEAEEPTPQRYSGEYNIVYDDENEKQSHYCSDFTIIDVQLNDDGDYEITYTVKTYRDDSGNVILSFACYDEDGGRVDGFSELFHTWAYSWTEQEAVAVVSSDTAKIKLMLNE